MDEREGAIRALLERCGWKGARRERLAGDASFRHYERVRAGRRTAVLMDAPPGREDVRPYVQVDELLRRLGYSAPRILGRDVDNGLLLLEDLGDDTFTRVLARNPHEPEREQLLYESAVDLLIDLHRRDPHMADALPPYDDARLLNEAGLLVDWYMPAMCGEPTEAAIRAEYLSLWTSLFPVARSVADTLVLRDYHVDNLMWLSRRRGIRRCGLLDFQDAVRGPLSYDLVSLLEDARRDIAAPLVADMRARYLRAFPDLDAAAFEASYAVLGAQRNAKIIGIFTRLAVRDAKPVYLGHIPRVWRLLEADLAHPALAPMRAWLDRRLPKGGRGVPKVASVA
jgi:aminoglycoside/choline kinase family phosphotransferase